MELCSIASGSSGNCIYVGSESCHILIDAGISGKRIENGLNTLDLKTADMQGILITHEHVDHIAGLGVIARRYGIPMYATAGTIEAVMNTRSVGKIDAQLFHEIRPKEDFCIGDLTIEAIPISHDAAEPVAYKVKQEKKSAAVMTDLGYYDERIVSELKNLDVLLLEANHDVHMLQAGSYPYPLKQRILGTRGHLSNESSGRLLGEILHNNFHTVILGHLSRENNYPQLAYETVRLEVTMGENPYKGDDFPMSFE
jgi:phosphoribosyl 1,2-cyclic phosphodiesterase